MDTFTLDGLMSAMLKNNECAIGLFDEMSTFDDSLDKGSNKSFDRSRFLTLFGAGKWKKSTMTSGERVLKDPRFNMASFTQPHYLQQFADNNAKNGTLQKMKKETICCTVQIILPTKTLKIARH